MKRRNGLCRWLTLVVGFTTASSCFAIDGVALSVGDGLGDVEMLRLTLLARQWDHPPDRTDWHLRIHWEFGVARWRASHAATGVSELYDADLTPVIRFVRPGAASQPYLEFGIGAHVLSEDRIADRVLSSTYHFGSHVGIGLQWGEGADMTLRYQHLSNASLETPNPGIDFAIVRLAFPI